MLYKLIWLVLQSLFTLCEHLKQLVRWFQEVDNKSYDRQNDYTEITNFENIFLDDCRAQLSKLPRHLCLIIGPNEEISEDLFTRILFYALHMKIGCISFYDTRVSEKPRIRLNNLKQPKGILSEKLKEGHMLWTVSSKSSDYHIPKKNGTTNGYTNAKNGYKNGIKTEQSIEIYEIESHQGRKLIADVSRQLFLQRQTKEVQEMIQNHTLGHRIDRDLSERQYKCTDPELCIIFNKNFCTFGVLPWNTRFTEFYLNPRGHLFNAKNFAEILFKYSRCEQRWGE